jgi:polysaccharide pyruvyl transferase WcaK-like protein
MTQDSKKNIVLCGATTGSNFGDMLFAIMFVEYLRKSFTNLNVSFVSASKFAQEQVGLSVNRLAHLHRADAFVYISGGYFGETPKESFVRAVRRFFRYYALGLVMRLFRKPIAIIGVGSGTLNRWFLRWPVVTICNGAKAISVRESNSKEYLEKYGVKTGISVTSDSAQCITNKFFSDIYSNTLGSAQEKGGKKTVLVHFTRMSFQYDYPKLIVSSLKRTMCLDEAYQFILSHDGDWIDDQLKKIRDEFPAGRAKVHTYTGPVDLLKLINEADVVITPKLHVGIIGCAFGKTLLSFPYHPKVQRYYQQIGFSDHCVPLVGIQEDDMVNMIKKKCNDKIALSPDILAGAWKNFEILGDFCESIGGKRAIS